MIEKVWSIWYRRKKHPLEPETAIFSRLRLHLTLWYGSILGGALIIVSMALYFGAIQIVGDRVTADLSTEAEQIQLQWQAASGNGCPLPSFSKYSIACFSRDGRLTRNTGPTNKEFLKNTLATIVLRESPQTTTLGGVASYAQVVQDSKGHGILGVIQVGEPNIGRPLAFVWLFVLGILLLFTIPLGGIWLAKRAVAPARIAFKQQKEFIANASHELRTPLALLRANAEVLLRGRERMSEEDAELLEDIVADAAHMGTLANNMLLLTRIDSGQQHIEQEIIDLAELAKGIMRRAHSLANCMHITLEVKDADTALMLGDRIMLEQVLLILLDNAMKYNQPEGCIRIHTYIDKAQVHLEISDTGVGIAAEDLQHIGKRFYRVDKAHSSEVSGSGLGLSIAYSIVAAHHGTLILTSEIEQGTTVKLSFPIIYKRIVGPKRAPLP